MEQPYQQQVQIEVDEATSQGMFINMAFVSHTETEFILDFIYQQPQLPKAKVRARIISTPPHTKRLLEALTENVKRYETSYGPIKQATQPGSEKKVGF